MRLKELVANLPCDGATTLAVIGALDNAGILDAEVYGLDTGKVSVVAQKLRERAIREGWLAYHSVVHAGEEGERLMAEALFSSGALHESYLKNMGVLVDAVLSVVLGDVQLALAVGTVSVERVGYEGLSQAFLIGGGGTLVHDLHGEVVALLEEK